LKGKITCFLISIFKENLFFRVLTDIRRHLKNGNRTAAMKLLRKKKLLEREHDKKESTIEHLNTVLTQIEQTDCSSLVKIKLQFFFRQKKKIFGFFFSILRLSMRTHQVFKPIKNYYVKMVLHLMQLMI